MNHDGTAAAAALAESKRTAERLAEIVERLEKAVADLERLAEEEARAEEEKRGS